MGEKRSERVAKYNLASATEDTYASQTSQNPTTARRVQSLFPTPAGYLEREQPNPTFATNTLPSPIVWLFEYDQSNSGATLRFYFCATATTLYQLNGAPGSGAWVAVPQVGTLSNQPQAIVINNLMHFSDGVSSYVFDGASWVVDGMPIPQSAPVLITSAPAAAVNIVSVSRSNGVITVTTSSGIGNVGPNNYLTLAGIADVTLNQTFQIVTMNGSATQFTFNQPGFPNTSLGAGGTAVPASFSVTSNRYYWTTFSDQSTTHPHESTSSPRSLGTGPITSRVVFVSQRPGLTNTTAGSPNIAGVGTNFAQTDVGMYLSASPAPLKIISVQDAQHLTLASNAAFTATNQAYVIAPLRATHWNIYCSEAENSSVGFFLASIPINQSVGIDQSPFSNVLGSYIDITLQRPLRSDPTTGTRVMAMHKRRIFRRNEKFPNNFNYTAFEEVKSGGVSAAEECVPGHDPNTLSDLVNEQPYPDQSRVITGMVSHADALFIGTEKTATPMFGESIDDFVLSQITAFSVGFGSQYALKSMPHGLAFLSYDRKVYLWPQQWIPFYAPEETTSLIELSRPKRLSFQNINPTAMAQTWFEFFNYGKRNWLVTAWQDNANVWHTYVFDFETKGWFEMQRGVQALLTVEVAAGVKALVGGGTDGKTYILDDPSVFFPITGLNFPAGTFRPALIDFGQPDTKHLLLYVEYELSNVNMASDFTVNYYLDPIDVDNPGTPVTLTMTKVRGANRFRGFFTGGGVCERVLLEFLVASSQNGGVVRSITLAALPVSKLIF